jgi:hypothetical protein
MPRRDAGRRRRVRDGLSFPHDVDVSADGKFAAIANYGDDSVRIALSCPSA